jgi:hypothetical protein
MSYWTWWLTYFQRTRCESIAERKQPRRELARTAMPRSRLRFAKSLRGDCTKERLKSTQCMVRPCVARGLVDLSVCGLASMYPASDWSVCAPGHHGHQRAYVLISGQTSSGPFGSPGFACAVKTDPPSRLNLSQTSAGNGKVMLGHRCLAYRCSSFVRAIRLFLRLGLQSLQGTARRGCQDWPPSAATHRAWS